MSKELNGKPKRRTRIIETVSPLSFTHSKLISGTIMVLAMMAVYSGTEASSWDLIIGIIISIFVIALGNVYAQFVSQSHSQKRILGGNSFRKIFKKEMALISAAMTPLFFFVLAGFGIITIEQAYLAANLAGIIILFAAGLFLGRSVRRGFWVSFFLALVSASIGALLVLLRILT